MIPSVEMSSSCRMLILVGWEGGHAAAGLGVDPWNENRTLALPEETVRWHTAAFSCCCICVWIPERVRDRDLRPRTERHSTFFVRFFGRSPKRKHLEAERASRRVPKPPSLSHACMSPTIYPFGTLLENLGTLHPCFSYSRQSFTSASSYMTMFQDDFSEVGDETQRRQPEGAMMSHVVTSTVP